MRKFISALWIAAGFLFVSAPAFAADQTIGEFEAAQQAAWNAHDAGAYTAALDENAEIVAALGWHWSGHADAAHNIGDGFKFVYARAHMQLLSVQPRMLTPELASVTLIWMIDGARTIDTGLPAGEQRGFETQLLQRRGGSWFILSQQDTAAAPSPPSPPGSSPSPAPATAAAAFPTAPPPVRRCIVARGNGDCLLYGKAKPAQR